MGNEDAPKPKMATIGGLLNVIDSFHGSSTENIREFFNAIEAAAGVGNWQADQKLAVTKLHMKHEAAHYLEANPDVRDATDWATFKNAVMLRFEPKEHVSHALQNLMETTQRQNETVSEFATRLKLAGQKAFQPGTATETATRTAVLQETLMAQFLRGLKRSLKRAVLSRAPTSFQEAITVATSEEQNAKLVDPGTAVRVLHESPEGNTSGSRRRENDWEFRKERGTSQRNNWGRNNPNRNAWPQGNNANRGDYNANGGSYNANKGNYNASKGNYNGNRGNYNDRPRDDSRYQGNFKSQENSASNSRAPNWNSKPTFSNNKQCFECHEVGHYIANCPKIICKTCGVKGHSYKVCPTKPHPN